MSTRQLERDASPGPTASAFCSWSLTGRQATQPLSLRQSVRDVGRRLPLSCRADRWVDRDPRATDGALTGISSAKGFALQLVARWRLRAIVISPARVPVSTLKTNDRGTARSGRSTGYV